MGAPEALIAMNTATLSTFGVSATYTPSVGDPVTTTVIHADVDLSTVPNSYGVMMKRISLLQSAVTEPQDGDVVTIESVDYTVRIDGHDYPLLGSTGMWMFYASKSERRLF